MTNAFAVAYPSYQGIARRLFGPTVDPFLYLRALHLLFMFPLGVAYFTFFVTVLSIGASLVWTFIGPPVLLIGMWVSLRLADGEAWMVSHVAGVEIRRPPQRLEGVTSFRQRLWARAIDPTTWTGLLYEVVQFPLGIAGFVLVVVLFAVAGGLISAPLVILATGEPTYAFGNGDAYGWEISTPREALALTPLGFAVWLLSVHVVLLLSSLHAMWARLMLGSKTRGRPASLEPEVPPPPRHPDGTGLQSPSPDPQSSEAQAASREIVLPDLAAMQTAARIMPRGESPGLADLTPREWEVTLLMAQGMSNADIAEACFISEGTVKTHVKRILSKLDLHDRTQVVVFAYERGLVMPGSAAPGFASRTGG